MKKILIVDDDEDILFSAKVWLKKFFTDVKNNGEFVFLVLISAGDDLVFPAEYFH